MKIFIISFLLVALFSCDPRFNIQYDEAQMKVLRSTMRNTVPDSITIDSTNYPIVRFQTSSYSYTVFYPVKHSNEITYRKFNNPN